MDGSAPEAGDVAELVYRVEDSRGLRHFLQRWDGQQWVDLLYGVASDRQGFAEDPGTPWAEGQGGLSWTDEGYAGTGGGLFVTVPEAVDGQIVRLCAEGGQLCSDAYDLR